MGLIGFNLNSMTPYSSVSNSPVSTGAPTATSANVTATPSAQTYTPTAPGTDSVTGSNDVQVSNGRSFDNLSSADKAKAREEAEVLKNLHNNYVELNKKSLELDMEYSNMVLRKSHIEEKQEPYNKWSSEQRQELLDHLSKEIPKAMKAADEANNFAQNAWCSYVIERSSFMGKWGFDYNNALK